MELKEFLPITILLVAVGFLVAIGILAVNGVGTSVYETDTHAENITVTLNTRVALDHDYLIRVTNVTNTTNLVTIPSTNYTVDLVNGAFILRSTAQAKTGDQVEVTYTYKAFSAPTRTATNAMVTELGNISTNWLGLIITIAVLSIVLLLVVRSFSMGDR
jgi:hypothetical protein